MKKALEKAAKRLELEAQQWESLSEASDEEIVAAVRATAKSTAGACRRHARAAREALR